MQNTAAVPGYQGGRPTNQARLTARARRCGLRNHRWARSSTEPDASRSSSSPRRPNATRASRLTVVNDGFHAPVAADRPASTGWQSRASSSQAAAS